MALFFLAVVVILASIHLGSIAPFLIASVVAGVAQGATFSGSLRALLAESTAAQRAGLLAVVYAISYTGAAVPAVIAGQLARTLTLLKIALGYGALAAIACVLTLVRAENPANSIESRGREPRARAA